jgi:hypothetical protein
MEEPGAGHSALKEFQHVPVDQQQSAADRQHTQNLSRRDFFAEHQDARSRTRGGYFGRETISIIRPSSSSGIWAFARA